MSEIRFVELCCQRCGGELEEKGGAFVCKCCGKKWLNEKSNDFNDMLNACEEANRRQRVEDIANLRQLLWKEISKEYVSNKEVERLCKEIQKYLPKDFYANFFLATCAKDKAALGDFLYNTDVDEHFDDIPLILDYLLKALKPEWAIGVSDFIEKIKDIDMELFHTYRTRFEEEYKKIDDNVFEADLERDVFVAYSSKDMPKVNELVNALEAEGLSCFVAARNMRHGSGSVEDYSELLHTAINHCQVFVFVSSKNSRTLDCDAWREEINYIIDHRKDMPRVEFVIQNYCGRSAERNFKKFFSGLEYCTSAKDVLDRVTDILMHGWKVPKIQTGEEPQVETIETTVETHVDAPEQEQPDTQPIKEKQKKPKTKKQPETIPVFNDERDEIYKKGVKLKHSELLGYWGWGIVICVWTLAVGFEMYDIFGSGYSDHLWIDILIVVFFSIMLVQTIFQIIYFGIFSKCAKAENLYNKGVKFFKKNDYENAVKFYREAAEMGCASAQCNLGYCYDNGYGVTQSYTKAVKWYQLAAELGDAQAQYNLGYCLKQQGVGISLSKSTEWFKKAALNGNKDALLEFEDEPKKELKSKIRKRRALKVIRVIFTCLIAIALGFACVFGSAGLTNWIFDTAEKDGMTFELYSDGYRLTGYTGDETDLVIPEKVRGIKVVCIYEFALKDNTMIESVTIPDSVTHIHINAFEGCTSLESVTLGENLTIIGSHAFYNCTSLTNITIPNSVTSINVRAFEGCTSLESVTLGENLTIIGSYAFYNCTSLTNITIPNSVTSINNNAFWNCDSLTSVTFENTSGWYVSESSTATSGTEVDVTDPAAAATYLTTTYYNYYWKR